MKKLLLGALVALVAVLGLGLMSATAGAQTANCETYGPACSTPTTVAQVEAATVSAAQPAAVKSDSLAFTGGDIAGMVAIALGLVVVGLVVVRTNRRRVANN